MLHENFDLLTRSERDLETKISECHRLGSEVLDCQHDVTSLLQVRRRSDDAVSSSGGDVTTLTPAVGARLETQLRELKHVVSYFRHLKLTVLLNWPKYRRQTLSFYSTFKRILFN